jgi:translocation and assembly module TamB
MKRKLLWAAGIAGALGLLAIAAAILLVQSSWFYNNVRERLVTTIETATGGRAEIGSFHFDWHTLRAEVRGFTLHGTETAGKPPLLHADSVAVGFKVISFLKPDVDIESLQIVAPRVSLIVKPDGSTNMPSPKGHNPQSNTVETILKLAIGRFDLTHGQFAVESHGTTPFEAHGRNLAADFLYDPAGPRYRGELRVAPLEVAQLSLNIAASLALEKNRIAVSSATLTTTHSSLQLSGTVDDLASPHAAFNYFARLGIGDADTLLHTAALYSGTTEVGGSGTWSGGAGYNLRGSLRANGFGYRDRFVHLHDFHAEGALTAHPGEIRVAAMRVTGATAVSHGAVPLEAHIADATLKGKILALNGMVVSALGGTFTGAAALDNFDRYHVSGATTGIEARRAVAVYSPEPLPWDGLVDGPVRIEGSFRQPKSVAIEASLAIAPAAQGEPVHGHIQANYSAQTGILDLGQSTLALPHSSAEISGAVGRQLRVHVDSHDLNDILPAVGESAASFPVRLDNGRASFDGTVTGSLDAPQIAGHLNASGFVYRQKRFDALAADVAASPSSVSLRNATAARGAVHAQFAIAVALADWKALDDNAIFGNISLTGAPVPDLTGLIADTPPDLTGTAAISAQVAGSIANPIVTANLNIVRGAFRGEPFDTFSGRATYTNSRLALTSGHVSAGPRQVSLEATFDHPSGQFSTGRLRFQVATNSMALDQIRTIAADRPGLQGNIQATANGTVEVVPSEKGRLPVRIDDLHADIAATNLVVTGQAAGSLHLTANSQNQLLKAHLEGELAHSTLVGNGQWQLSGDYPGNATLTFSQVNLAQLRGWLSSSPESLASNLVASAQGTLRIQGPALQPRALTAELRIPSIAIGPEARTGLAVGDFTLRNNGDLVATLANYVVTVQSARLTGRNTDLKVSGKIALDQKNPLDLKVSGKADLGALHDWNRDFTASGSVIADASIRGALPSPQVSGRLEFQQAAFNIVDVPNGISNANGAILFTGDRASFQRFSGETGGGTIRLSGFIAYGGGPMVYRLHANVQQVRVRYPEGVSTVADAGLSLTGTTDRSMLSGTITIRRTSFNPQSDFSSLVAQSAEPVRTPSARQGFLGGLNFDVQISTAPDIQVQSSLTQDVQLEANLRLRGTVSSPALLGRVNVTHGQLLFFGTRYNISQGSISFFNPLAVEPILDVDLETKARGIEVTLNVSGPLNKLNLTPRSDPPLQFNEIVALLATGRAPTADTSLSSGQSTAASSFQQMGASALLGQAIANPVSGRLQRFFGVSRLRIDPTLPGTEYNPQARLTLEQQVTQNITFTYITDVTSTNPQMVSVEWAFSKQWSVVVQREENGMVGMDILFKRRF